MATDEKRKDKQKPEDEFFDDASSEYNGCMLQLFTNTDYKLRKFPFGPHTVEAFVSEAATTDFDLTGQIVWPGTAILSWFLVKKPELIARKTCLELGSGTGIPGLLAGQFCDSLVLTDHNDNVLDLLRKNVEHNSSKFKHQKRPGTLVCELNWGDKLPTDITSNFPNGFDCLIGADIVYSSAAAGALFRSVDRLLSKSADARFYLGYVRRWADVDRAFLAEVKAAKFELEEVELSSFMPDSERPEHGAMFILKRATTAAPVAATTSSIVDTAGASDAKAASTGSATKSKPDLSKFEIVFSLTPSQVRQMQALYHQEWLAKNWTSDKTLESVQRMLDKSVKLLVAVVTAPSSPESASDRSDAKTDSTASPDANANAAVGAEKQLIAFGTISGDLSDPLLEDIIVDAKFRGCGLGALVMRTLLQHEKLTKCARVELYCREHLLPFYEKFGFRKVRGNPGEKQFMRLTKSPPAAPAAASS